MVNEQVDIDTKLANVPVVHLGVSSLEHDLVSGQFLHDTRDDVCSPRAHILGDTLGLDHQTLDTGVQEPVAQVDQLAGIGGSDGLEVGGLGVTTGSELDTQFRLGLELVRVDLVHQTQPVILGDGEEAGRELDQVEAVSPLIYEIYQKGGDD